MENKSLKGIITKKDSYVGDKSKHPAGYFTIDGLSFSLWDENIYNSLEIGKEYSITYSEKQYGSKIYYNCYSIDIEESYVDSGQVEYSVEEMDELDKVGVDTSQLNGPKNEIILKENEIITIGGFKYLYKSPRLKLVAT